MEDNQNEDIITVKVKSQDNEEIHFKIKRNTPMKKMMQRYCERNGLSSTHNVEFLYEGEQIYPSNTPDELGLNENDEISVVVKQIGGDD